MPDKTEDKKPQLVQPEVPGGGIYEKFREPVPGTKPAASPVDAAAATAAAVSVEPGLQAAILKLLPQWRPLLQRVEALEKAEDKTDEHLQLAERDDRLDKLEESRDSHGASLSADDERLTTLVHTLTTTGERLDAMDTRINERLDALASVVAELQEELGADEEDGGK